MWCDGTDVVPCILYSVLYTVLCTVLHWLSVIVSTSDTNDGDDRHWGGRLTVQSKSNTEWIESIKKEKEEKRETNKLKTNGMACMTTGGFLFQFWAKKPVAQRTPHHTLNSRSAVSNQIKSNTYIRWSTVQHLQMTSFHPLLFQRYSCCVKQNDDKVLWWIQRGRAAA